jgi:hypothetical protein
MWALPIDAAFGKTHTVTVRADAVMLDSMICLMIVVVDAGTV